ncbi:MAG: hypothetical protein P8Y49_05945 [Sulfurovaceae bacterium]
MNSFKEETNARQALYSFIARLMLVEVDEKFLTKKRVLKSRFDRTISQC